MCCGLLLSNWQGVYAQQKKLALQRGHTAEVVAYDLSPDGTQLLTSAKDKTIKLWQVSTGSLLKTYQDKKDQAQMVKFAEDGQSFLSSYSYYGSSPMLWRSVKTGKVVKTLSKISRYRYPQTNYAQFFEDANGKKVLARGFFIDLQSGKVTKHSISIGKSIAFSPDKKQLITNGGGKVAILWDLKHREIVNGFVGHTKRINSVNYSLDGKQVLTASADATMKLWDAKIGKLIRTFKGGGKPMDFAAFAPNGQQIVSFTGELLFFWDATSGKLIRKMAIKGGDIRQIRFVQNKVRVLVMDSKNEVGQVWEFSEKRAQRLQTLNFVNYAPDFVAFDQNKAQAWLRIGYGKTQVWDFTTQTARQFPLENNPMISDVRFSADGNKALVGVAKNKYTSSHGYDCYDLRTGKRLWATKKRDYYNRDFGIIANGQFCRIINQGNLEVLDIKTGKREDVFKVNNGKTNITSADMNYQSNLLLTTSSNSSGKIWNLKQKKIIDTIPAGKYNPLTNLRIVPGSKMLFGWGDYGDFFSWDIKQHKKLKKFKISLAGGSAKNILFSRDGRKIIAREDTGLNIWDLKTGKKLQNLPTTEVEFFQYVANQRKLLVGKQNGVVQIWQLNNGKLLGELYLFQVGQKLEWVATTPENKYDGSKKGLANLHYRFPNNSFKSLPANDKNRVRGLFKKLLK